jgi:hypothetical protein
MASTGRFKLNSDIFTGLYFYGLPAGCLLLYLLLQLQACGQWQQQLLWIIIANHFINFYYGAGLGGKQAGNQYGIAGF